VLDLASSEAPAESGPEARAAVHRIHSLKTAALFGAAAELGAIAANADEERCRGAAAFGRALGLAFQATDDLLDVTGDAATLGKTPGKDAALERSTLVAALGLPTAREEAERLAGGAREVARALPGSEPELLEALVGFVLARRA
jgi:geranylgeranyl pyrophosphate synthase